MALVPFNMCFRCVPITYQMDMYYHHTFNVPWIPSALINKYVHHHPGKVQLVCGLDICPHHTLDVSWTHIRCTMNMRCHYTPNIQICHEYAFPSHTAPWTCPHHIPDVTMNMCPHHIPEVPWTCALITYQMYHENVFLSHTRCTMNICPHHIPDVQWRCVPITYQMYHEHVSPSHTRCTMNMCPHHIESLNVYLHLLV